MSVVRIVTGTPLTFLTECVAELLLPTIMYSGLCQLMLFSLVRSFLAGDVHRLFNSLTEFLFHRCDTQEHLHSKLKGR